MWLQFCKMLILFMKSNTEPSINKDNFLNVTPII